LPFAALLPFAGALLIPFFCRDRRGPSAWLAALVTAGALALIGSQAAVVVAGQEQVSVWQWAPQIGLYFAFRLDGLSLLFAVLILGMGLLIVLYARYYLSPRDSMARFFAYLLLFMGAMLGLVLSENLLQMVIFWELTSLSSFLLISFWGHRAEARRGARMALAITGAGGLALLAGVILIGQVVGSYALSDVLSAGALIQGHALYPAILTLVLLGAFTKSAQFPFHFWLPHAMAAPTPVSAYLHSATMVKAGVFLLARLYPALSGTPEWTLWVSLAGLATLLLGAYTALFKHDLKGLLAYSTLSHLGLITLLFGTGTALGAVAGLFHIINHATFKASLFMAAGIIDHETGTRDMRRLSGLARYMPMTAALAMIAAAAMAGVPLLNGFLSKEMFFEEMVAVSHDQGWRWVLPGLVTLAGLFSVAYSLRFVHDVFFNGAPRDLPKIPHEPPRFMRVPVEILVVLCLLVGIVPNLTVAPLLALAAAGTLQGPLPDYSLAIWHGLTPALFMTLIALAGGVLLYVWRAPLFAWHERTLGRLDARSVFDAMLTGLLNAAGRVVALLDNGGLQRQMATLLGVTLLVAVLAWGTAPLSGPVQPQPVDPGAAGLVLLLMLSTLATVLLYRQRFAALLFMGVAGLAVSLLFVQFSAPDLALTQLSVEVVSLLLLLLVLFYLPDQGHAPPLPRVWRDAVLALLAGAGAATLTWAVLSRPYTTLAEYYLAQSRPLGGGNNVVNVILVDFRGFDTLGEITVLALAGLGVAALLSGLALPAPGSDVHGRRWAPWLASSILTTLTRLLLPLGLLVSVFIFLRGHNLPGGGFIAGLVTAVALVTQYLASGLAWGEARVRATPALPGWGLLAATVTGLASLVLGYPFLTSTHGHIDLPVVGEVELASAMGFDLGVYLVVVGATLLILAALGRLHREEAA
jgi:multicomponent K+:H+ antiporter subunit A